MSKARQFHPVGGQGDRTARTVTKTERLACGDTLNACASCATSESRPGPRFRYSARRVSETAVLATLVATTCNRSGVHVGHPPALASPTVLPRPTWRTSLRLDRCQPEMLKPRTSGTGRGGAGRTRWARRLRTASTTVRTTTLVRLKIRVSFLRRWGA